MSFDHKNYIQNLMFSTPKCINPYNQKKKQVIISYSLPLDSNLLTKNKETPVCDDQIICLCYQCINVKTCSCCGKRNHKVQIYNSSFCSNGSLLCDTCYMSEKCPGCGCESAGDLCKFCRSEYK